MITETEQSILLLANSLYFQDAAASRSPEGIGDSTSHVVNLTASNAMAANHPLTSLGLISRPHNDHHLTPKAIHITSNIWPRHRIGKDMRKKATRRMLHGVEIRTLDKSHVLSGETGLFASLPFRQFDIVGEYCGVVKGDVDNGGEYAAHLQQTMSVNAQEYGNETRSINHFENIAKDANVIMKICHVEELPRVLIVCKVDIAVGEEFLLNYGDEYVQYYLRGFDGKASSVVNHQKVDWSELSGGGGADDN